MRFFHMFEEKNNFSMKSPLVEIVGYNRILVENHFGIVTYSTDEIHVKVSYGKLCVIGSKLSFLKIAKEQLIITGCIDSVRICRRQL